MPEFVMDESNGDSITNEPNGHYVPYKEIFNQRSPRSPLSTHSPESDSMDLDIDGAIDTSIEQLYRNVCEMQSSDQSPSRRSFLSYGEESRIDSELRYLAGGDFEELEITKEVMVVVVEEKKETGNGPSEKENESTNKNFEKIRSTQSAGSKSFSSARPKRLSRLQSDTDASAKLSPTSKSFLKRPPTGKRNGKTSRKPNAVFPIKDERNSPLGGEKLRSGNEDSKEARYLGPYLLKQTREVVSAGDNPQKALELALRAMKSFENCADGKPNLELVMCLHVVAALYCSLGQYSLEIQRQVLGEKDPQFGETCRYVAEAHVQAMQFDDAEKLCQMALNIHRENGSPASPEEAAD
ncbi:hypothetical protein F0562_004641 [Nyssa sinensis]|uniref:MalT-like TPR region domain-containing protein n=1 Tax=Nyssa sinensis TaxID=561372 RepID=A0A5J5BYS6_9ASTE|nr:hypothetical protein F0562_004641 [Nyssa sinensis]